MISNFATAGGRRSMSDGTVPRLETERLILRAVEARDVEPYLAMMGDPEVTRFLGDGHPLSRSDAWRQLAMLAGHWVLRGCGMWVVEEKHTGAFVGRIGCLEPEGWPGFEIGYVLAQPAWGRGYAREGATAALRHAREVLGRERIISLIRPGNTGSIAVATSLGAVVAERIELFGAATDVYRYA
jgi:RimJ/RimL family protein N-acetyltransferase